MQKSLLFLSISSFESAYAIPANCMQIATQDGMEEKVFPATLDAGYTFCDDDAFGKVIQRKVLKKEDERVIFQDSNNSAEDFSPNSQSSFKVR